LAGVAAGFGWLNRITLAAAMNLSASRESVM
jgi:hypothetical protein